MSLPISASMRLRPAFILSASAISAGESMRTTCWVVESTTSPFEAASVLVNDAVDKLVDADLVRPVVLINGLVPGVRPLPELGDIGAVVAENQHPLVRIVVLEQRQEMRRRRIVVLRDLLRVRNLEERMEHRVRAIELHPAALRKQLAHLEVDVAPVVVAVVVENEETAFEQ